LKLSKNIHFSSPVTIRHKELFFFCLTSNKKQTLYRLPIARSDNSYSIHFFGFFSLFLCKWQAIVEWSTPSYKLRSRIFIKQCLRFVFFHSCKTSRAFFVTDIEITFLNYLNQFANVSMAITFSLYVSKIILCVSTTIFFW